MKRLAYILLMLINLTNCSSAQDDERISNINLIFDKMELQGVDTEQPLLYGYFFFDKNANDLKKLNITLVEDGYKTIRLEKEENSYFILHVEKIEAHTRSSLLEREKYLDMLSKKNQVEVYDGWDVGNPNPEKPLISIEQFVKSLKEKSDTNLYKLASDLYDGDMNELAIAAFRECLNRNLNEDTCHFKQGVCHFQLGQLKKGIINLERTLRINPNYFKACFNLGAVYYDNQDYQKSIEYYQKALLIDKEDDKVYYGLAASQFVLGQLEKSKENCKIALEINSNNINARTLLENINSKD